MTAAGRTLGFAPAPYKTRKARFLDEMERIRAYRAVLPARRQARSWRVPALPLKTMLRVHCLLLWWNFGDLQAQEELCECPTSRKFAGLDGTAVMPDETTILRFRRLLKKHALAEKIFAQVNEMLAAAP